MKNDIDLLEFRQYYCLHTDLEVQATYNFTAFGLSKFVKQNKTLLNLTNAEKLYRRKINCVDKHGITWEEHERIAAEKRKQTNLERFGVEYASSSPEVHARMEQTCLERYGVKNPSNVKEFQEKRANTNIEKFGYASTLSSPTFQSQIKQTCLEKYGVENPFNSEAIQQKCKTTIKQKYGVDNPFQAEECKQKSKQTCLEKYGTEYISQSTYYKEKYVQTCLERYGVPNVSQVAEIKEKIKATNLERYGFISTAKSPQVKLKAKQHFLDKYGVDNIWKVEGFRDKIIATNRARYGVDFYCELARFQAHGSVDSKPNKEFARLLDKYNIPYSREFRLSPFCYDFKVQDILIEINPSSTHQCTKAIYSTGKVMPEDYHMNKYLKAKEEGYKCIHVWDWDSYEEIVKYLWYQINQTTDGNPPFYIHEYEVNKYILTNLNPTYSDLETAIYTFILEVEPQEVYIYSDANKEFYDLSNFEIIEYSPKVHYYNLNKHLHWTEDEFKTIEFTKYIVKICDAGEILYYWRNSNAY